MSFLLKRTIYALVTLLVVSLVSFALMRSLPASPIDVMLGSAQKDLSEADLQKVKDELALDRPVEQYGRWLLSFVDSSQAKSNLAMGLSYKDGRNVKEVIMERIPATVALVGFSLLISFTVGIPLGGFLAFLEQEKKLDKDRSGIRALAASLQTTMAFLYALPNFFLAFLFLALCATLPWLYPPPSLTIFGGNQGEWLYLIAPAFILSLRRLIKAAFYTRSLLIAELNKAYVIAAKARGLSFSRIFKHVLANCKLPLAGLLSVQIPALIGGSVLIETIFCIPGLGRLSVESALSRNYPVMMGLTMLYGSAVVLASFLSDLFSRRLTINED
ncbi:MAG: ABC transporter permease [Candidatus Obscuribacter phosphatis]|uniref:ABC transporter permease n=1 Tax=Candidatus Obscuribacter phosphatis TaxID=1906157 RepID=A0A8J7PN17_9BACT|nr:ABC transporter permease [Candidatus Obscuribacter phosphatis]